MMGTPATNRHSAWLAERDALIATVDAASTAEMSDDEAETLLNISYDHEDRILATPALNDGEAHTKLLVVALLIAEGRTLKQSEAQAAVDDVRRLAGEAQA